MHLRNLTEAQQNRLLAALPKAELRRWLSRLEPVSLPMGQVLCDPGNSLNGVWFPTTAIVALLYLTKDGGAAEVAVVGNDGMVGLPLVWGSPSTLSRAVVQCAGQGLLMNAQAIKQEFCQGGAATHLLLRYGQALVTQIAQTAACNRHHRLDQQLCRWLLMSLDRLHGNELAMTHESIANMLGVRREGVTESALKLQKLGLIRYVRGHIDVLDRQGLEARACECYRVVQDEYQRLLPASHASVSMPEEAVA